jgi:uncharacterized protein (DUF488 family)
MEQEGSKPASLIYTIGHSTHPLHVFIAMLLANEITHLLDVRTIPRSRRNPQFNQETLASALCASSIDYLHVPGLGGLRRARKDSINGGWRNASFRGYADYMQTADFAGNIKMVLAMAASGPCALMCAEAVPWRCHRSLIADALVLRGLRVEHIMSIRERRTHVMTPWARTNGLEIVYPSGHESMVDTPITVSNDR